MVRELVSETRDLRFKHFRVGLGAVGNVLPLIREVPGPVPLLAGLVPLLAVTQGVVPMKVALTAQTLDVETVGVIALAPALKFIFVVMDVAQRLNSNTLCPLNVVRAQEALHDRRRGAWLVAASDVRREAEKLRTRRFGGRVLVVFAE